MDPGTRQANTAWGEAAEVALVKGWLGEELTTPWEQRNLSAAGEAVVALAASRFARDALLALPAEDPLRVWQEVQAPQRWVVGCLSLGLPSRQHWEAFRIDSVCGDGVMSSLVAYAGCVVSPDRHPPHLHSQACQPAFGTLPPSACKASHRCHQRTMTAGQETAGQPWRRGQVTRWHTAFVGPWSR